MCAFSKFGKNFVSTGNMDRTVIVWELKTNRQNQEKYEEDHNISEFTRWENKAKMTGHERSVWDVKFMELGKFMENGPPKLLSASADYSIKIWNADPNSLNA